MTKSEFSLQFDVLYNNETSNQAPDLNEYEKSVFATKAEYEVIKNYINSKGNKYAEGVDESPKRHVDLSNLVSNSDTFPTDAIAILEETIKENGELKVVIPISYKEYQRLLSKPYSRPLKKQVWRIEDSTNASTFIGHTDSSTFSNYNIRYIKMPNPIILWSTESDYSGLTIQGCPKGETENNNTIYNFPEIELPDELMQEVLQRAVELAKAAWLGDLSATLQTGQRSE